MPLINRPLSFVKILMALLLLFTTAQALAGQIALGVYAYQSKAKTLQEFAPIRDHLARNLPNTEVVLKALSSDELRQAARQGTVDVLIVNPNLYEIIRHENFIQGIVATLERTHNGIATSSLGGVIFTRANHPSIHELSDIDTHTQIAIPCTHNTGAYRIPLYELHKHGIDTPSLQFLETQTNDGVVNAILEKRASIGFVRTGVLENYVQQHPGVSLQDFRVLNPRALKSYPFLLSTGLYPEWAVLVLPKVDKSLSRKISALFYSMEPTTLGNPVSGISGFVPPLDYQPFENLLRELRLPPYDSAPETSLKDIWQQYRTSIIVGMIAMVLLLAAWLTAEQLKRKFQQEHRKLLDLISATRAGTWEWNIDKETVQINHYYAQMLGYEKHELAERPAGDFFHLIHADDLKSIELEIATTLRDPNHHYDVEFRMRCKKGEFIWVNAIGSVVSWNKDGSPRQMDGILLNINQQKLAELELHNAANTDHLTGLMNRRHFSEVLCRDEARLQHTNIAILFIDLDGFKAINDQFGHQAGDYVLRTVANRLIDTLRADDLVARIGGDEIVIKVENYQNQATLKELISRLQEVINQPIDYEQQSLNISCSIGISEYQSDTTLSFDQHIQMADKAMYHAKQQGKNRYAFYEDIAHTQP